MITKDNMRLALAASALGDSPTAFALIRRATIMGKQPNIDPIWLANALYEELTDRKLIVGEPPSW